MRERERKRDTCMHTSRLTAQGHLVCVCACVCTCTVSDMYILGVSGVCVFGERKGGWGDRQTDMQTDRHTQRERERERERERPAHFECRLAPSATPCDISVFFFIFILFYYYYYYYYHYHYYYIYSPCGISEGFGFRY